MDIYVKHGSYLLEILEFYFSFAYNYDINKEKIFPFFKEKFKLYIDVHVEK